MLATGITASLCGITGFMGYHSVRTTKTYLNSLRGRDSIKWPKAEGEIIRPLILQQTHFSNIFNVKDLKYAYYVQGKKFYGERFRYNDNCLRLAENTDANKALEQAQETMNQFRQGKQPYIAYHPHRISESVLIPGPDEYYIKVMRNDMFISLLILVVFFALTIMTYQAFNVLEHEHSATEEIEAKKAELVRLEEQLKEKKQNKK